MKILHVIHSLKMGGAERLLSDLCPLLKKESCEIDVLVIDGTETPFMRKLIDEGVHIFVLDKNSTSQFRLSRCFKLIPYICKYDIVHSHLSGPLYYVALANLLSKHKAKLVHTEHNTNNRRRDKRYLRFVEKKIYGLYSQIICVSQKAKENLEKHIGEYGNKIQVIRNGINLETFRKAKKIDRSNIGCTDSDFVLTMVSRFGDSKDQKTIIKALPLLPDGIKLVLVGDGPLKKKCEELSEELGVKKKVVFLGLRSDIPQILQSSDVIVLSSHWEGLSLSSIEGMAVGKPFVASDVDGLHEIAEGAALLFREGDSNQFADIVLRLKSDLSLCQEVSEKCFVRAKQFDISDMARQYAQIYKDILISNKK